jgi:glycerol uptake facilitator-like aquaporin
VLVSAILCIKYNFGAKDLPVNAMVVGTTLFAMISASAMVSGAALNPAIGIVQQFF